MKWKLKNKTKFRKFIAIVCLIATITGVNLKLFNSETKHKKLPNEKTLQETLINESEKKLYEMEIGLDKEIQKFIYNKCKEFNLDYIKTLGLICSESNFDCNAISETDDYGLFQINIINHDWLSKTLNTENKPLDPMINIEWGTYLLNDMYSYWATKGLKGKELDYYVWSTYNQGYTGCKKNGLADNYIAKINNGIDNVKEQMESNQIDEELRTLYLVKTDLEKLENSKKTKEKSKRLGKL